MHDEIVKYTLEGEINDDNIVKRKEELVRSIETMMRDEGVVPNIDLLPQFTLDYKPEREVFVFTASVYGIHVGEGSSWEISGITDGKIVPKVTQKIK